MGVNSFAKKMFKVKEEVYRNGVMDGLQEGLDLAVIALNHEFGFGEARLNRLEKKVQELINEIVDTNDPIVTKAHIEQAIKQIRGEGWNK